MQIWYVIILGQTFLDFNSTFQWAEPLFFFLSLGTGKSMGYVPRGLYMRIDEKLVEENILQNHRLSWVGRDPQK